MEEEVMKTKIEKPRCDKCNSSQVYVRRTLNELVCKTCGYIKKLEDKE